LVDFPRLERGPRDRVGTVDVASNGVFPGGGVVRAIHVDVVIGAEQRELAVVQRPGERAERTDVLPPADTARAHPPPGRRSGRGRRARQPERGPEKPAWRARTPRWLPRYRPGPRARGQARRAP